MVTGRYNEDFVLKYCGLSTDTKPTDEVVNGSTFFEIDTSKKYMFDEQNQNWIEQSSGGGGGSDITVESLSVTENGTYTAPTGKAYSPVTVNVESGGGVEYTKLEHKEYVYNLANDTTFNEITPSTTVQTISSTENIDIDIPAVDLDSYDIIAITSGYVEPVYSTDTPTTPFEKKVCCNYISQFTRGEDIVGGILARPSTLNLQQYLYNNGNDAVAAAGYGVYVSVSTVSLHTSDSETGDVAANASRKYGRRIRMNRGAMQARANTSYASLDSLSEIDADNTNIKFEITIYKVSKTEQNPFKKVTASVYMLDANTDIL